MTRRRIDKGAEPVGLTPAEREALKFACRFCVDEDTPGLPTRGPLFNAIRRALAKLERIAESKVLIVERAS